MCNDGQAIDLEEEVMSQLREQGDCDMGALRQAPETFTLNGINVPGLMCETSVQRSTESMSS